MTDETPTQASLTEKATVALKIAVARVVEEHRKQGRPLAVWRDFGNILA